MIIELTFFGVVATLCILSWQLGLQVREIIADDVCNFLVAEMSGGDKEAFSGSFWALSSPYMRQCKVSDVNPKERACGRNFILGFSEHYVPDSLIGCIERV